MKAVDAFFKVVTICFFNSNNAAFYRHSGGWMAPSPHNKKLLASTPGPTNSSRAGFNCTTEAVVWSRWPGRSIRQTLVAKGSMRANIFIFFPRNKHLLAPLVRRCYLSVSCPKQPHWVPLPPGSVFLANRAVYFTKAGPHFSWFV